MCWKFLGKRYFIPKKFAFVDVKAPFRTQCPSLIKKKKKDDDKLCPRVQYFLSALLPQCETRHSRLFEILYTSTWTCQLTQQTCKYSSPVSSTSSSLFCCFPAHPPQYVNWNKAKWMYSTSFLRIRWKQIKDMEIKHSTRVQKTWWNEMFQTGEKCFIFLVSFFLLLLRLCMIIA